MLMVFRPCFSMGNSVWPVLPGFTYRLRYSEDMVTWLTDLPNSGRAAAWHESAQFYTDTPPSGRARRYYQVTRE